MKTSNLAIVFTDIKGFTARTSQQTHEENQRLLAVHEALLAPLFRSFGGRIVKTIGDAFLATFESPTQAVLCGAAIQDRLWLHNQTAPDSQKLEVRVAINVGEVRVEGGDVFGEPVNIAARVEGIAEAGEIYFTEAVHLSMNKAEVPAEEVGAFELKGIPDKVRVYRVPRAPYRMGTAPATELGGAQPPYGNLGLARVTEAATAGLGDKVASLSQHAAVAGAKALDVGTAWVRRPESRRPLLAGAAAVLAAGSVLVLASLWRSPVDKAIREVESATVSERPAKVEAALKLIRALKERGESAYYQGRLEEAQGRARWATNFYEDGVRANHAGSLARLIELLEHPECRVRAAAADTLGALKAQKARRALETLAKQGGPNEQDIPIIGCNSRRAAEEALRELAEPAPEQAKKKQ